MRNTYRCFCSSSGCFISFASPSSSFSLYRNIRLDLFSSSVYAASVSLPLFSPFIFILFPFSYTTIWLSYKLMSKQGEDNRVRQRDEKTVDGSKTQSQAAVSPTMAKLGKNQDKPRWLSIKPYGRSTYIEHTTKGDSNSQQLYTFISLFLSLEQCTELERNPRLHDLNDLVFFAKEDI